MSRENGSPRPKYPVLFPQQQEEGVRSGGPQWRGRGVQNKACRADLGQESSRCPSPLLSQDGPRVGKGGGELLSRRASWGGSHALIVSPGRLSSLPSPHLGDKGTEGCPPPALSPHICAARS